MTDLKQLAELRSLADEMSRLKYRLGAAGMFKTMHLMDEATKALGYEMEPHFARAETDHGK